MRWTAVMPVKGLPAAKTRLGTRTDEERASLALAFARDAVAAVLATPAVVEVVVVTSDPDVVAALSGPGVVLLEEPAASGLNAALTHGAETVHERVPMHGVLAICADLPALRATDLGQVLVQAASVTRAYVADAQGTGTTLLTAGPGQALQPRFGPGSAKAHARSGAVALADAGASLRRDVDTPEDLAAAVDLGVGRWTAAALGLH